MNVVLDETVEEVSTAEKNPIGMVVSTSLLGVGFVLMHYVLRSFEAIA
jgi:hypothetical protein